MEDWSKYDIIFDLKPEAVPYNYRISYKLAQLCLIIVKNCSGRSGCPLIKLHIISNALKTGEHMKELEDYINGNIPFILVRFDPAVNRAIKYAIADELVYILQNGSFKVTEKGKKLIKQIEKENLMISERIYLSQIGTKLCKEKIDELLSLWRYTNAKN